MDGVSRRNFLGAGGVVALVPVATDAATRAHPAHPSASPAAGLQPRDEQRPFLFFNAPEAAFVTAAVDRLIPPDALGPSATEADVHRYIDLQLHGAWGAGERLYRAGPWQAGTPSQGYQLPYTPADLYRTAVRGIREDLAKNGGRAFEQMSGDEQDRYLTMLQTTSRDLGGVPSNVFFESLLAMTVEGYFSDPAYGGNRDMAAWKMIGFPGAYASYYELVDQPNVRFDAAPRSLAEDASGHVHETPDIPAFVRPPVKSPTPGVNTPGHGAHHAGKER
ncbi:MAG TPA: gluconate 2-dehydrogenase subunit 3 family protein [Caldimonas sp.]|nr:gluconate 2-dehydrogenase subunit 3 family protein [Caldimonas sp.]